MALRSHPGSRTGLHGYQNVNDPAIRATNLSKQYRIGRTQAGYRTIRETLVEAVRGPFRRARRVIRGQAGGASGLDQVIWALRDITFQVEAGEVVGIIGRNGAGKSTLLKILARITEPTEGEAWIHGRVGSLLEVGSGFHPELTGRENIFLNGAILGMHRAEIGRKFDEIVTFAEVEKFLDTPVKFYSSGMYVRLAFAVAAHLEPEVLLVDEVLAVGDAPFQQKCLGKMSDVARSGRTVLFVSHNMDAILHLCTMAFVLQNGRMSEAMPAEEAVKHHLAGSSAQEHAITLLDKPRVARKGVMPVMARLDILAEGAHTNVIRSGASLTFELTLADCEGLSSLQLGIALLNRRRQRVVGFHTHYHSGLTFAGSRRLRLRCHIPALPLVPGTYFVDLILSNNRQVIERLESAASLEVIFADLFGTGRLPDSNQGNIALPCRWSVHT
jgi:lipopolysaccharide transport system ATP-binding protein